MGRLSRVIAAALVLAASACASPSPAPPDEGSAPSTSSPFGAYPLSCGHRSATTTRDIAYATAPGVDRRLLSLDLTVPTPKGRCGPAPVVVWVHGGGFAIGDKANGVADMARWATENGWAFASVNHRLSPNPPALDDPERVQHPTHVTDVAAAVAWLADHAEERRIDPEQILLVGHSAGAFLVALLATDAGYLEAAGVGLDQVRAAVVLDTRFDIASAVGEGTDDSEAIYTNAFGHDPATWRAASPMTHVGTDADEPPLVVVTRGQAGRVGDARAFAAAAADGTLVDARPMSHARVGAVLGRSDDTVVTPVVTDLFSDVIRIRR